jgi:4-diphosphocytidyl-2-C-methyl-D-erythritol kinase
MRIRTYAKVNLFLKIEPRLDDGYHPVDTIYHSVSLADEMELTERPAATSFEFTTSGIAWDRDHLEEMHRFNFDNLVVRAAHLLEERLGVQVPATMRLHKNIPVGAGLAGGSSNAAAALVGLNQLLDLGLTADDLLSLAIELGSDVPFCMIGGTARAVGRGEVLMPAPEPPDLWFVLGISNEPLMTKYVYAKWDEVGSTSAQDVGEMVEALEDGGADAIARAVHNDLQAAALALRPGLADGIDRLQKAGALSAMVCGSGPTVMGMAGDLTHAREVAAGVDGSFDRVEVVHSVDAGIERLD